MENLKRVQRNTHRDNNVFILYYFSLNRIIIVLTNVIPIDITHLTIGIHCQAIQALSHVIPIVIHIETIVYQQQLKLYLNRFTHSL